MQRYDFKYCYVLVMPEEQRVETHYPDGTVAHAVPHDTDSYRATAVALGYGTDTWAMTIWHELMHTAIAELRDEHHSGAVWAQAHKPDGFEFDPTKMPAKGQAEEARLFEFQRLLNSILSNNTY